MGGFTNQWAFCACRAYKLRNANSSAASSLEYIEDLQVDRKSYGCESSWLYIVIVGISECIRSNLTSAQPILCIASLGVSSAAVS